MQKPTKHEMVLCILKVRYNKEIELCRVGKNVKPRGAGARKEYNKYMTLSIEEIEKFYTTAQKLPDPDGAGEKGVKK